MSTTQPNRTPNNFGYRIAKSGNIVCNNGGYQSAMGSRGAHVKVIACPHPEIHGEYVAEFGAHRDRVAKAAAILGVKIHRTTTKSGHEIFE
jgi:hypothetical protein